MEQKKLLWVIVSVGAFIVLVLVVGLVAFYPRNPALSKKTPVSLTQAPKTVTDPADWVRTPGAVPGFEQPRALPPGGSDMIQAIGTNTDKPAGLSSNTEKSGDTVTVNVVMTPPETTLEKIPPKPKKDAPTIKTLNSMTVTTKKTVETPKKTVRLVDEYWIQAFSTKTRSRAEETQRYFAQSGLPAIVTTKDIDGAIWYRIRIGPYAKKIEADAWLAKIKKLSGYEESYTSKESIKKTVTQ